MTIQAGNYGDGLYELAVEEKKSESIMDDILLVWEVLKQNPDYIRVLCEPSIHLDERLNLLEEAFSNAIDRYLVSFLKLLCENGLFSDYVGCFEEYQARFRADHNIAEAYVVTAVALSEEQRHSLSEKLQGISGKSIILSERVDPQIIGGIRVEIDGIQYDGTLRNRLSEISSRITKIIM